MAIPRKRPTLKVVRGFCVSPRGGTRNLFIAFPLSPPSNSAVTMFYSVLYYISQYVIISLYITACYIIIYHSIILPYYYTTSYYIIQYGGKWYDYIILPIICISTHYLKHYIYSHLAHYNMT